MSKTLIPLPLIFAALVCPWTTCLTVSVAAAQEENVAAASSDTTWTENLESHISLSQGYLISSHNDWVAETRAGSLQFNEFAANISYDFTDKFRAGLQLMSRDFGPLMNNDVYLDWAVVDYRFLNELGIKVGRLKVPYGLYSESRDVDSARITILLPSGVYAERARDTVEGFNGGALYGTTGIGAAGSIDYFIGYGEKPYYKDSGTAHYATENNSIFDEGSISTIKTDQTCIFQAAYDTPLDGLRLVGSYVLAKNFHLQARSSRGGVPGAPASLYVPEAYGWTASLEYTKENFVLSTEYKFLKVKDQKYTFEHALAGTTSVTTSTPSSGWYISGSYRFTDWFAAELYYSELYPDDDDHNGSRFTATGQADFLAWQKDISLTGRFDVGEHWIFKAGVTFSDGLAGGFTADYPPGTDVSRNWILYQLKATFVF